MNPRTTADAAATPAPPVLSGPLQDIRVLDLTGLLPGPLCTLYLADMGADVIKIEAPGGDDARRLGTTGERDSTLFQALNRNKRGLRLDLKDRRGRDIFLRLAKRANVVIEGFRPGVVTRLGIDYPVVQALNPAVVYCGLTGYGQTGPYRDRPGHDLNYCGYAGISEQIGAADGPPVLPNFQIADIAGGALSAAMGILAALLAAQRNGQGRYLDVAMTDCALANAVISLSSYASRGATAPRGDDMLSGALACYNIYRTADDGYMAVAALEKKFWARLCEILERTDLIEAHLAAGQAGREVKRQLADIFASHSRRYWTDLLAAADCCVSPILNLGESHHDPHLQTRGMFIDASVSDAIPAQQYAFPIQFSGHQRLINRAAPRHGEHNTEILGEAGYSSHEIERLASDGVV